MWDFKEKYENEGYVIPDYMMRSIERYVMDGIDTGSFLYSVLINDFVGAISNADENNKKNIVAYAGFVYNHIPSACWGNAKKVLKWIELGGLNGMKKSSGNENGN